MLQWNRKGDRKTYSRGEKLRNRWWRRKFWGNESKKTLKPKLIPSLGRPSHWETRAPYCHCSLLPISYTKASLSLLSRRCRVSFEKERTRAPWPERELWGFLLPQPFLPQLTTTNPGSSISLSWPNTAASRPFPFEKTKPESTSTSLLSLAKTQTRPNSHSHRHLPCRTKNPPGISTDQPRQSPLSFIFCNWPQAASQTPTVICLQRRPKEREEKESKLNVISSASLDLCLPNRRPKKKEGSTIYQDPACLRPCKLPGSHSTRHSISASEEEGKNNKRRKQIREQIRKGKRKLKSTACCVSYFVDNGGCHRQRGKWRGKEAVPDLPCCCFVFGDAWTHAPPVAAACGADAPPLLLQFQRASIVPGLFRDLFL